MTSRFTELGIDCADPRALASFWCGVLGYRVQDADEGIVSIGPTPDSGEGPGAPILTFARVPESKMTKNRLHLDLNPSDRGQSEEVERLLALGARPANIGQGESTWVVLADPEGNEFCVLGARRP